MMRDFLCSDAQYQRPGWLAAQYLCSRLTSVPTTCQLRWRIQFVMICQPQRRGHHNIHMVTVQDALKDGVERRGFFCPLPSISFPSLSLALSHKSHLPNSCLRSEIILRLFFTVAAQRWICKRFFFFFLSPPVCACACVRKVCLLSNKPAVSERSMVWREMLGEEVARWDWVLNILRGGCGALPAPVSSAGSSNNGRLPHLSQQEHIYISSPRGTLRDEVSSNWIWISLHQG